MPKFVTNKPYWCLNRHLCGLLESFGKKDLLVRCIAKTSRCIVRYKLYHKGCISRYISWRLYHEGCISRYVSQRVYLEICITKGVSRDMYCEGCILRYILQRLGCIKVLIMHRQTLIKPTGYERCHLCVEVYCWSYSNGWLLPARLSKLNDNNVIKT